MKRTLALLLFGAVSHCNFLLAANLESPLDDAFGLTLSPKHHLRAYGPAYYAETVDTQKIWAVPPVFSFAKDPAVESEEFDFLYPLLSYDRYGEEYRFHIFQVFAFAGGQTQAAETKGRFTLFPFYFQQRSDNPEYNYTALLPIYGTLRNRLFRDEVYFILMPAYVKTRKKDVVTYNYLYPFFHLRHGNELKGWQFWPVVGHETKGVTYRTNQVGETEIIGGHDKWFSPWPFFLKQTTGLGTDNPERQISVLPLFTSARSPKRDSLTAPWPLGLTLTDDRDKKYKEIGVPWPLIVFARGEGKHTSRVWPLYSRARTKSQESNFYLWPIYKYNRFHADALDRERMRILFFLYSDTTLKNVETGQAARRVDFWPLFTSRRDLDGNRRFQALSLLEPLLPNSKSIERNYSPIWAVWRSNKDVKSGMTSQSLLWNLYRRETTSSSSRKTSYLFGLVQVQTNPDGRKWRFFYFPGDKEHKAASAKTSDQ